MMPTWNQTKRAEAYVVLASKDWDCSFKITELPSNKTTTVEAGNRAKVSYKKPQTRRISQLLRHV